MDICLNNKPLLLARTSHADTIYVFLASWSTSRRVFASSYGHFMSCFYLVWFSLFCVILVVLCHILNIFSCNFECLGVMPWFVFFTQHPSMVHPCLSFVWIMIWVLVVKLYLFVVVLVYITLYIFSLYISVASYLFIPFPVLYVSQSIKGFSRSSDSW